MTRKSAEKLSHSEIVGLEGRLLRDTALRTFHGMSAQTIRAMDEDALRIDVIAARLSRGMPAGYFLGHAHGHGQEGDDEIRTLAVDQIIENSKAHVDAQQRAAEIRVNRKADEEAKQVFTDMLQQEAVKLAATDKRFSVRVLKTNPHIAESSGSSKDKTLAIQTAAKYDGWILRQIAQENPDLAKRANAAGRKRAQDIRDDFYARKELEQEYINNACMEMASAVPEDNTERYVQFDLQVESYNDTDGYWITHRIYRWAPYSEIIADADAIVAQMRSAMDELLVDTSVVGTLRIRTLSPKS